MSASNPTFDDSDKATTHNTLNEAIDEINNEVDVSKEIISNDKKDMLEHLKCMKNMVMNAIEKSNPESSSDEVVSCRNVNFIDNPNSSLRELFGQKRSNKKEKYILSNSNFFDKDYMDSKSFHKNVTKRNVEVYFILINGKEEDYNSLYVDFTEGHIGLMLMTLINKQWSPFFLKKYPKTRDNLTVFIPKMVESSQICNKFIYSCMDTVGMKNGPNFTENQIAFLENRVISDKTTIYLKRLWEILQIQFFVKYLLGSWDNKIETIGLVLQWNNTISVVTNLIIKNIISVLEKISFSDIKDNEWEYQHLFQVDILYLVQYTKKTMGVMDESYEYIRDLFAELSDDVGEFFRKKELADIAYDELMSNSSTASKKSKEDLTQNINVKTDGLGISLIDLRFELKSIKSTYKIADRITRWSISDINKIRRFTDGRVMKYKNLSSEEILKQRMFHHLPGICKFLDIRAYAFPNSRPITPKGCNVRGFSTMSRFNG